MSLILSGGRSKLLLIAEVSCVFVPTPDEVATLRLDPSEELSVGGCDILQNFD